MRIIFLDIDGPMIPVRSYYLPNQTTPATVFDPIATAMINALIDETGAKIVISSTHRLKGRQHVFDMLTANGISLNHVHHDWSTMRRMTSRSDEIVDWLNRHAGEVTHYVAVDDELLEVRAVRVSSINGIGLEQYEQIIEKLNMQVPQ